MSYEQKADAEKELSDIRREVIETRNLIIKTDHLLKTLHAEVKIVGKRHEDLQKRQWLSSVVAYVIFAFLCLVGAIAFSSARTSSISGEQQRLEKNVSELSAQLQKERAESNATQAAQRAADQVYRMMTALPGDERLKGVEALAKLDTSRLSPLEKQALIDRAAILKKEIGQATFERGKAAFRRNDYPNAATELRRFLAMNPDHQDLVEASFFLGISLDSIKKYDEAVPALTRFVSEDKHAKIRDFAMLILAHALEQTGQLDKAAEVAREALGAYPNSQFGPQLRLRLGSIRHQQQSAAQAPEAAANPAAAGAPNGGGPPAPTPASPPAAKPAAR